MLNEGNYFGCQLMVLYHKIVSKLILIKLHSFAPIYAILDHLNAQNLWPIFTNHYCKNICQIKTKHKIILQVYMHGGASYLLTSSILLAIRCWLWFVVNVHIFISQYLIIACLCHLSWLPLIESFWEEFRVRSSFNSYVNRLDGFTFLSK